MDSSDIYEPNKPFLESILKRKVLSFKCTAGSKPGDNYDSVLTSLEIWVDKEKEPLHLLFKTFPRHPTRQTCLTELNIFSREFKVYDVWLPELEKFQKSVIKNDVVIPPPMPELVAGAAINYKDKDDMSWKDLDPMLHNFLLMVDVRKAFGFKMANKMESLEYSEVKQVFDQLAKYHALGYTYKVHHKLPNLQSKLPFIKDSFFLNPEQRENLEGMVGSNMTLLWNLCHDFFEGHPEIAKSLEKYKDGKLLVDHLITFFDPEGLDEDKIESWLRVKPLGAPLKEQWISVGHGDCWTNNAMFKYDSEGNAVDCLLLDLSMIRETCITVDILNFLYTSTDTEFRKRYLQELLVWYFERFSHYCKALRAPPFPGFSLENFLRKIHRAKIFGVALATLSLPIILQRPENCKNLDTVEVAETGDKAGTWADVFQNLGRDQEDDKVLQKRYTDLLLELHEDGIL